MCTAKLLYFLHPKIILNTKTHHFILKNFQTHLTLQFEDYFFAIQAQGWTKRIPIGQCALLLLRCVTWKCVNSFQCEQSLKEGWMKVWPMDEGLLHFGIMESAKTRDSWSPWDVEGAIVLHLLCFLFLWCFVACKWWFLFFFLHGCDSIWCLIKGGSVECLGACGAMECEHCSIWRRAFIDKS